MLIKCFNGYTIKAELKIYNITFALHLDFLNFYEILQYTKFFVENSSKVSFEKKLLL